MAAKTTLVLSRTDEVVCRTYIECLDCVKISNEDSCERIVVSMRMLVRGHVQELVSDKYYEGKYVVEFWKKS